MERHNASSTDIIDLEEMHKCQEKAIDDHYAELIKKLQNVVQLLLVHLQNTKVINADEVQLIKAKSTNREKLIELLALTKPKDNSWQSIIDFLEKHQLKSLARKLQASTGEVPTPTVTQIQRSNSFLSCLGTPSFKDNFKSKLRKYYKSEYSRVSTIFGCHKHVQDVWVPLRFEDKTENPKQNSSFNHIKLLRRLRKSGACNTALVKGHPGTGKTTLVKKIAYDWAAGCVRQFSLVFVIPLRYVGSTLDFLQLTADYYSMRLHLLPSSTAKLLEWLKSLGRKLLICLDGLDEYGHIAQSPLKSLFTEPLHGPTKKSFRSSPLSLPYQLLITSRPYACDLISLDFFPLKFEICCLDQTHLAHFVRMYCGTDHGIIKVTEYLEVNTKLITKVPLILTFICYLADVREEIPTNVTSLHARFLSHMVKRENELNRLTETINPDKWKNSKVAESTAKLAFMGCKNQIFEFSEVEQQKCGVSQDSFTCGFMISMYSFSQDTLCAEFPHRSIQEFFAAIHCYQLISTADKTERNSVMKEILKKDSQFGRFLFGICSEQKKFKAMLDWLNPTFGDAEFISFNFGIFLSALSASLSDCSEAKLFGERLTSSLDELEDKVSNDRDFKIKANRLNLPSFDESFQSSLNLQLSESKYTWSICRQSASKLSRLTYVRSSLPANFREKCDKVELLVWQWEINDDMDEMCSSLHQLPSVSSLIVLTDYDVDFEINFRIKYKTTWDKLVRFIRRSIATNPSIDGKLRNFTFGFVKLDIPKLQKISCKMSIDDFTITESHKTGEKKDITWVTVDFQRSLDQHDLLKTLIKLAAQMHAQEI